MRDGLGKDQIPLYHYLLKMAPIQECQLAVSGIDIPEVVLEKHPKIWESHLVMKED